MAFCPVTFGGVTVTASCAVAPVAQSRAKKNPVAAFVIKIIGDWPVPTFAGTQRAEQSRLTSRRIYPKSKFSC
jgi:hypothetical protein